MEPEKKQNGAFVGVIVILIILIIGGIYIWQSKIRSTLEEKANAPIGNLEAPAEVTPLDSTALDSLDKEINTTDTNTGVDVNSLK